MDAFALKGVRAYGTLDNTDGWRRQDYGGELVLRMYGYSETEARSMRAQTVLSLAGASAGF